MRKPINWRESFASTHLDYNPKSWRLGCVLFSIASLGSIAFFQFANNFSPEFKVVLNFLWFPFFQIGLTYSCFMMGFDYYTDRPIKWKAWMKSHANFYKTYYFWAIFAIVCAMVGLAVLQKYNPGILNAFEAQTSAVPWQGYTGADDSNAWYGLIALYSLIPIENYYIVGTSLVTAYFWFILVGPFFYNWMNRVKFSTCTTLMVIGLILALFSSGWTDFFWTSPDVAMAQIPWWSAIGDYTIWYQIIYMFLAGFYIRKYTRVIPWRIALLWFGVISAACIAVETVLDFEGADGQLHEYTHALGFNNYFIGASFCSLPIMVLSWLAINVFAQWKGSGKAPTPRIAAWNRFNEYSPKYIGDLFAIIGGGTKWIFGFLILKLALNIDVQAFNALRFQINTVDDAGVLSAGISKFGSNPISIHAWGWLMLLWSIIWSAGIVGVANVRMQLFDAVAKLHARIRRRTQDGYVRRQTAA